MADQNLQIRLSIDGAGNVTATVAGVRQEFSQLGGEFGKLGASAIALNQGLELVEKGFELAGRAIDPFVAFVKESMAAAEQDELALQKLSAALDAVGSASPVEGLVAFAEAESRVSIQSKDAIIDVERLLTVITGGHGDVERLTKDALDLAAGLGIDAADAARALAKATEGNFTALKRFGITVDESKSSVKDLKTQEEELAATMGTKAVAAAKAYGEAQIEGQRGINESTKGVSALEKAHSDLDAHFSGPAKTAIENYAGAMVRASNSYSGAKDNAGKLDEVLGKVEARFAGQAQAEADTYAGKVKLLAHGWEELEIAVGNAIIKSTPLRDILTSITGEVQSLTDYVGRNEKAFTDLVNQGISLVTSSLDLAATSARDFAIAIGYKDAAAIFQEIKAEIEKVTGSFVSAGKAAEPIVRAVRQVGDAVGLVFTNLGPLDPSIKQIGTSFSNVSDDVGKIADALKKGVLVAKDFGVEAEKDAGIKFDGAKMVASLESGLGQVKDVLIKFGVDVGIEVGKTIASEIASSMASAVADFVSTIPSKLGNLFSGSQPGKTGQGTNLWPGGTGQRGPLTPGDVGGGAGGDPNVPSGNFIQGGSNIPGHLFGPPMDSNITSMISNADKLIADWQAGLESNPVEVPVEPMIVMSPAVPFMTGIGNMNTALANVATSVPPISFASNDLQPLLDQLDQARATLAATFGEAGHMGAEAANVLSAIENAVSSGSLSALKNVRDGISAWLATNTARFSPVNLDQSFGGGGDRPVEAAQNIIRNSLSTVEAAIQQMQARTQAGAASAAQATQASLSSVATSAGASFGDIATSAKAASASVATIGASAGASFSSVVTDAGIATSAIRALQDTAAKGIKAKFSLFGSPELPASDYMAYFSEMVRGKLGDIEARGLHVPVNTDVAAVARAWRPAERPVDIPPWTLGRDYAGPAVASGDAAAIGTTYDLAKRLDRHEVHFREINRTLNRILNATEAGTGATQDVHAATRGVERTLAAPAFAGNQARAIEQNIRTRSGNRDFGFGG